jgi:hypothetical protein
VGGGVMPAEIVIEKNLPPELEREIRSFMDYLPGFGFKIDNKSFYINRCHGGTYSLFCDYVEIEQDIRSSKSVIKSIRKEINKSLNKDIK